jgi:hypothetical protein
MLLGRLASLLMNYELEIPKQNTWGEREKDIQTADPLPTNPPTLLNAFIQKLPPSDRNTPRPQERGRFGGPFGGRVEGKGGAAAVYCEVLSRIRELNIESTGDIGNEFGYGVCTFDVRSFCR